MNANAACSKYIFMVPNGALSEEEKDFAVAFATPSDAEGLTFIVRPAPEHENPDYESVYVPSTIIANAGLNYIKGLALAIPVWSTKP